MSVFDEAAEQAMQKAFQRSDVQKAMQDMTEQIVPYISLIISAALEEMKKTEKQNLKRSEMNGE